MSRPRFGIVGVGYLGYFHAQKYARSDEADLVGVADIIPERAKKAAQDFGCQAYPDHRDLIGQVEAASVAVPTSEHALVTGDLLASGIDCLVEKPLTATLSEADRLIDLAQESGAILQVGHLERFNPAVAAARPYLTRPLFFESRRLTPFQNRGTDVDVFLDLMIHDIDIILSLTDEEPILAKAVGATIISDLPDVANARLEFPSGLAANLTAGRISSEPCRTIQVFQADSHVMIDCANQRLTVFHRDSGPKGKGEEIRPGVFAQRRSFDQSDHLAVEIGAFVRSVAERSQPLVDGVAGRRALKVALMLSAQVNPDMDGGG
ncbi:MAG: Gfo/Idh/MocA family oxidoreductase [Deltaproteobacteria bacterium]|nr:Gfo/Idh/MocA family oxidoreductase [Deltaproteobacteria bacterium]